MNHLVIIDGHHLMYRAYYAIPRTLRTATGEQTNAVYGVASMLLTLITIEQPTHLLFCFDAGEETFRHQENATYKDGRAETPDEFYLQIPRIMEMIDAFGFRSVSDLRYEADDFLCTYATAAEKDGMHVTIVTGDRDALQLATDNVRIAIPHGGYQRTEYLDPAGIFAKYGVRPDQIASYKGLTGDQSDNLPGVHGIGPMNAAQLIQTYGNLKSIYEHLEEIKPAVRSKLENDREQAFFCERMATLVCDIELPSPLDDLVLKNTPVERAMQIFNDLEFTSLRKRLQTLAHSTYGKEHFAAPEVAIAASIVTKNDDQMTLF